MLYLALWIYFIIICIVYYFFLSGFVSIIFWKWVPYVPTYNADLNILKNQLKLIPWKKFIDLWCWDWKVLRLMERQFKLSLIVWYDINSYAVTFWKIINKLWGYKKIQLFNKNFLKADLSQFDYVYTYLLTNLMEEIEEKLFSQIGSDTIVISNTFKFKKHLPFETLKNSEWKDRIYLYKKN